ncbi:MAG: hypothetical protein ACXVX9_15235 [Mycobacteriaceae bacterium]
MSTIRSIDDAIIEVHELLHTNDQDDDDAAGQARLDGGVLVPRQRQDGDRMTDEGRVQTPEDNCFTCGYPAGRNALFCRECEAFEQAGKVQGRVRSLVQRLLGTACVHHWWPCHWCRVVQRSNP